MLEPLQYVLGLLSGSLVGFSLGLVGGGGSILAVPLMVYLVGVSSPHVAIGTSALAVAEREGRAVVIGLNKWDLVADKQGLLAELKESYFKQLTANMAAAVSAQQTGLFAEAEAA